MARKKIELELTGGDGEQHSCVLELGKEGGKPMLYCIWDGRRIAKRPPGGSWIALEPGWIVTGNEPGAYDSMSVEYRPLLGKPQ